MYIYIYTIVYKYITYIYIYIYIFFIYIYIYLYIYINLDNRIHSYTTIYSYTVNVSLMLICIELSELIIFCKYTWKFSVLEVMYYIFLFYNFLPINFSSTCKIHMRDTPSLEILVRHAISMTNNITRQCQRYTKNPVELLRWTSFTKEVNG